VTPVVSQCDRPLMTRFHRLTPRAHTGPIMLHEVKCTRTNLSGRSSSMTQYVTEVSFKTQRVHKLMDFSVERENPVLLTILAPMQACLVMPMTQIHFATVALWQWPLLCHVRVVLKQGVLAPGHPGTPPHAHPDDDGNLGFKESANTKQERVPTIAESERPHQGYGGIKLSECSSSP
jgi:hypothetical protein